MWSREGAATQLGAKGPERILMLQDIMCLLLGYSTGAKRRFPPVLTNKDTRGCIWVSEKTSSRKVGEQTALTGQEVTNLTACILPQA